MRPQADDVRIEMLGRFRVIIGGRLLDEGDWPSRRAQELVALLALSEGRTLLRDRVIEHLWPHLGAEAGAANLRKAAHHARRTLGAPETIVLRTGRVQLLPARRVDTDVEELLGEGRRALREADPAACLTLAAGVPGDLLPDAPYETWTQDPRRQVHALRTDLLRKGHGWEQLMELEPTDEAACRELMRAAIDSGQRHVALRWFEQLRIALLRELGAQPDAATRALYDQCTDGVRLSVRTFVGREIELADAAAQLTVAAGGGTAALLVRGPAGIGKSAFCREVVQRAQRDGWRVTTVTAVASGMPYAPIGAAVEQLLVHGRASVDALPERTRAVLAELSPLAQPAPPPLQGALTRHQVVAALRRALALPGPGSPMVLAVEDAHLLDEATAGVLHQLIAGGGGDGVGGGEPLLVVLACRAEWMRTSLPHGIIEAAKNGRTSTVQLAPLGDDDLAELVVHNAPVAPSPEVVEQIVRAAEGSPFFALELARGVTGEGTGALPRTVRQAITQRVVGLDSTTLEALTTLAVAEDELDLASVLALTGLGEPEAFALLDAALDSGVLVIAGARYRFRHGLVRRALTEELPAHRRLQLHRDAAGRLVEAGGAAELIAHHWLKGERPDEAVPWLLAATRRAVRVGAFADGLSQVERLLVEEPAHRDGLCLRAEILDALGDGRAPDAYAAAAAALGDPEAQELLARQALAQLKASNPDSALRTLEGVTPTTTIGRLAEALTLSAAAAIGRYADADTAALKAQEAHTLAVELGEPGAILDATWAQALAAHAKGELPARLREYLRATQDLPELATRVFDGQLCVTERMLYGGLPNDEIIAFADGLAGEAQRIGAARGHAFAVTLRGEALILAGELDDADRDFAEGARLHGQVGAIAGEALSLLGRAQVATQRGRPEHARAYLATALLLARESEVGHHTLDRVYGAMIDAARDEPDALRVLLEAETAIQGPAETCPTCRIAFLVPATIAAARGGDTVRAHRYAGDCATALEVIALPPAWHAAVEEAYGWVARADGRLQDAGGHFRHAADGFRTWSQPLDAQRCDTLAMA